ncbi:MAG: 2,3-bisphosphoglycerate-dependent phosphoglycerate mutase [Bacteroidota bacterium]
MPSLILLRHGQSAWNLENRFTGDVDVDITTLGEQEARLAGILLENYIIDIAYTSVLKRAIHTLAIILNEMGKNIPVIQSAALNERNYGDLQGLNKTETADKYGAGKVLLWRRSYDTPPPNGESLKDTCNRVVPYYKTAIEPQLKTDKNVLVVAHGNSLRALMMYLDGFSATEIADVNIATGIPRVYEFSPELKIETASYLDG